MEPIFEIQTVWKAATGEEDTCSLTPFNTKQLFPKKCTKDKYVLEKVSIVGEKLIALFEILSKPQHHSDLDSTIYLACTSSQIGKIQSISACVYCKEPKSASIYENGFVFLADQEEYSGVLQRAAIKSDCLNHLSWPIKLAKEEGISV